MKRKQDLGLVSISYLEGLEKVRGLAILGRKRQDYYRLDFSVPFRSPVEDLASMTGGKLSDREKRIFEKLLGGPSTQEYCALFDEKRKLVMVFNKQFGRLSEIQGGHAFYLQAPEEVIDQLIKKGRKRNNGRKRKTRSDKGQPRPRARKKAKQKKAEPVKK